MGGRSRSRSVSGTGREKLLRAGTWGGSGCLLIGGLAISGPDRILRLRAGRGEGRSTQRGGTIITISRDQDLVQGRTRRIDTGTNKEATQMNVSIGVGVNNDTVQPSIQISS